MNHQTREADERLWQAYVADVTPINGPIIPSRRTMPLRGLRQALQPSLDLHGMTLQEAHKAVCGFLEAATGQYRSVVVVTGSSGAIRREFLHWCAGMCQVRRVETMNGGGAFRLHFPRR